MSTEEITKYQKSIDNLYNSFVTATADFVKTNEDLQMNQLLPTLVQTFLLVPFSYVAPDHKNKFAGAMIEEIKYFDENFVSKVFPDNGNIEDSDMVSGQSEKEEVVND